MNINMNMAVGAPRDVDAGINKAYTGMGIINCSQCWRSTKRDTARKVRTTNPKVKFRWMCAGCVQKLKAKGLGNRLIEE